MRTNETGDGIGRQGDTSMWGCPSFPHHTVGKVGQVSSEMAGAPDSRCTVWRQCNGRGPDSSFKRLWIFA